MNSTPLFPAILARTFAWTIVLSALAVPLSSTDVLAHDATGIAGGFASGFMHPILGWDHVAAMVAVGLWGGLLGAPAVWLLPIVFPLVMAVGGAMGVAGVPVPGVEAGIAASAIALGILVATGARPPLWVAAIIVGAFAIFHGHAHGTELPVAADATAYAIGFVIGTGLLHVVGITFGLATKWNSGKVLVRSLGGAIAVAGLAFLTGMA